MKKIISYLSTKTILILALMLGLSFQHTTTIKYPFTASANSEVIESPDPTLEPPVDPNETLPEPTAPIDTPRLTSALMLHAFNPGYTVDGTRDVGEFIELRNTTDASLSLAGYALRYVNSSGKQTTLANFSEGSSMVGEFLLLRLARTDNSTAAEMVYTTTLAMTNSRLEILYHDEIVDQVCWSKDQESDCTTNFDSKNPSTLVRDIDTGTFSHLFTDYQTHYDPGHPTLQLPPEPGNDSDDKPSSPPDATDPSPSNTDVSSNGTASTPHCHGLEFTEILAYYSDDASEQFVELYNATDQSINLSGCSLNYKKKLYSLAGEIATDHYLAIYPSKMSPKFSLTKNPNSSNSIELLDADSTIVDILIYPHGQKKSTSYAKLIAADGSESWDLTYAITPGAENVYQEFRTCPTGKVINPATGNCIKVTTTTTTSSECPAGKYRNPLTGRCKNIENATSESKPCAEGYERNPETNRCRKIKAENDGAGYALVPTTYSSKTTFIAFGVVALLVSAGIIYIILQFRREIARALRKARQRLHHVRKDLITRIISLHRHKKP